VAVAPLLNVNVHAPLAVTLPEILALPPPHTEVLLLVMAAVGRAFTVTIELPVNPADTAEHLLSVKDETVYVVVAVGETATLNVPLPVPVAVAPLLNVTVHAPLPVTLPVILVLPPLQRVAFALVIAAVGRVLMLMVVLPVNPPEAAEQLPAVSEESV
jgi:hypothetical protein